MALLLQKLIKTKFNECLTLSLHVVALTKSTSQNVCQFWKHHGILFVIINNFKWYYKNIKKLSVKHISASLRDQYILPINHIISYFVFLKTIFKYVTNRYYIETAISLLSSSLIKKTWGILQGIFLLFNEKYSLQPFTLNFCSTKYYNFSIIFH